VEFLTFEYLDCQEVEWVVLGNDTINLRVLA
jgi:hypothetical protein